MNSPGFKGSPLPGVGLASFPFDRRLRQSVAIAEMFMRVSERRNGMKIEHGQDLDASAICDELRVLRDAPVMLRRVSRKEYDDCMQIRAG